MKIDKVKSMVNFLQELRESLSKALEFTLGNPSQEGHMPPAIGPQPYSQKPNKAYF